jgi:hypothetical protein
MWQLLTLPVTQLSDLQAIATDQQPAATRRRIGHIRAGDWAHCCSIRAGTGLTAATSDARMLPHIDAARKLADERQLPLNSSTRRTQGAPSLHSAGTTALVQLTANEL